MSGTRRKAPQFRVGQWVSLLYGPRTVLGQVVEDRGPIVAHGRRLYSVRLDFGQGEEATTLETPGDELTPAAPTRASSTTAVAKGRASVGAGWSICCRGRSDRQGNCR